MKRLLSIILCFFLINLHGWASYGANFCKQKGYYCIKIKKNQSWYSLWPDPYQRDVIKRLNRLNTSLYPGMTLAIPNNLEHLEAKDIAPFTSKITPFAEKTIIVSPKLLAWGAYDINGNLVKWGPISAGKDYCPDVHRGCHSKTGSFYINEKRGPECISTKFPVEEGGAPMPYCMFYYEGYALHGSPKVPGYHDSHGCIRLFIEDARWLNYTFTNDGKTHVIILPYNNKKD